MAHYPADTFQEATEIVIEASNQLHGVINGDANAEVTVEDGSKIPSVRKAMVDSLYFKPPIAWAQGEYEDTYNQLREFTDGDVRTWWFAKGAMVSTPVLMSTNPATDTNWTLWSAVTLNAATYETQKRLAAEAGLNMVGSFLLGATVTTTIDVVFYESDGKYYSWGGVLPKTVGAGSTPATAGGIGAGAWIDRTDVTLKDILMSDIDEHNTSPSAHPQLSEFISQEADRAEAAADAAVLSAGVYDTTTLGISATVNGQYFSVPSSDNSEYLILYKNISGVATEIKRYPSVQAVENIYETFDPTAKVPDALEVQATDGSVLARFDTNGAQFPLCKSKKISIIDKDGDDELNILSSDPMSISIAAEDGVEIVKFDQNGLYATKSRIVKHVSKDKNFGMEMDQVTAASLSSGTGLKEVNHIMLVGRSLAAGRGIIRYTDGIFNNISGTGANSIAGQSDPCSANITDLLNNTMLDVDNSSTEKFHLFAVDHCHTLLKRKKNINPSAISSRFVTSTIAIGGQTISDLSSNTLPLINGHIQTIKNRVEELGFSYNFSGFVLCHLDGDNETNAQADGFAYKTAIYDYMNALRTYAESVTGRYSKSIPVFCITQPNSKYFGTLTSEGNIAFYLLSKEDENVFVSSTTNLCEGQEADFVGSGLLHKSGYGTLSAGMNTGRCMYRYYYEGKDGNGLKPTSVTAINNTILLKLNRGNLFFGNTSHNRTSYISAKLNHGFIISNKPFGYLADDIVHTEIGITSVAIVGDTIKIVANSTIPNGYNLYCNVSDICSSYANDMYAATATDGTVLDPFDTLIDFVEEVVTYV